MGDYSFVTHLYHAGERDVTGAPGWMVAVTVGAIWAVALLGPWACIADAR